MSIQNDPTPEFQATYITGSSSSQNQNSPQPVFDTISQGIAKSSKFNLPDEEGETGPTIILKEDKEGKKGGVGFREKQAPTESSHLNVWEFVLQKQHDEHNPILPANVTRIKGIIGQTENGTVKFGVYQNKRIREGYKDPILELDSSGRLKKLTRPNEFQEDTPFRLSAEVSWEIEYSDKEGKTQTTIHRETVFLNIELPKDPHDIAATNSAKERALLQLKVYKQIMKDPLASPKVDIELVHKIATERISIPVPSRTQSSRALHQVTYKIGEGTDSVTKTFQLYNPDSKKNRWNNAKTEGAKAEITNWKPEILANLKKIETVVTETGSPLDVKKLQESLKNNEITPVEFAKYLKALAEGSESEFNQAKLVFNETEKPWAVQKWLAEAANTTTGGEWAKKVLGKEASAQAYLHQYGKRGASYKNIAASYLKFWDSNVFWKDVQQSDQYGFTRVTRNLRKEFEKALENYQNEYEKALEGEEGVNLDEARRKLDEAFQAIESHRLVANLSKERLVTITKEVDAHLEKINVVYAFTLAQTLQAIGGEQLGEIFDEKTNKKIQKFLKLLDEADLSEENFADLDPDVLNKLVNNLGKLPLNQIEKNPIFVQASLQISPESSVIFSTRQQILTLQQKLASPLDTKKGNVSTKLQQVETLYNKKKGKYEQASLPAINPENKGKKEPLKDDPFDLNDLNVSESFRSSSISSNTDISSETEISSDEE